MLFDEDDDDDDDNDDDDNDDDGLKLWVQNRLLDPERVLYIYMSLKQDRRKSGGTKKQSTKGFIPPNHYYTWIPWVPPPLPPKGQDVILSSLSQQSLPPKLTTHAVHVIKKSNIQQCFAPSKYHGNSAVWIKNWQHLVSFFHHRWLDTRIHISWRCRKGIQRIFRRR